MVKNNMIPLIAIDVALPVQAFRFEFTLIGKSDLPFIREFILRLLKIGSMSVDQIAKFLGLSEKEVGVALSQLISLNEIFVGFDGGIQLTAEAHKYFDGLNDSRPKVTKLFEGTNTFKFDMLSFNLVKSNERLESPLHALRLSPNIEVSSHSIDHAKAAFLQNYIDIFEKDSISFDGIDDLSKIELYKLSDVRKNRDYHIRFSVVFALDIERNSVERISDSSFFEIEEIQEKLNEILLTSYRSNNVNEIVSALDQLQDNILIECFSSEGVDLTALAIQIVKQNTTQSVREYFVGSITHHNNWKRYSSLINKFLNNSKKSSSSLYWLAPSDRFWMANEISFNYAVELFGHEYSKNNIFYLPIGGRNDKYQISKWKKAFGVLKNKSIIICEGFLGGSVEMLVIPGQLAIVCFYLQNEGEPMSLPFGFLTQDIDEVNMIHNEFTAYLQGYDSNMEQRKYGKLVTGTENHES